VLLPFYPREKGQGDELNSPSMVGETGYSGSNGSNVSVNSGITVFNASKLTNQIKQAVLDEKIAKAGYFPTLSASAGLGISIIVMITFSKVNNSSLDQF
jgi:hypothetical protein